MGMSKSEGANERPRPAIVLVHGAFADASGWAERHPSLQRRATRHRRQNPLSSYDDDVATTKRVIDAQKGPVVVVAHSYGGAVMSGRRRGTRTSRRSSTSPPSRPTSVRPLGPLLEKYPTQVGAALPPDAAGFIYLDRAKFHDVFAQDLPRRRPASWRRRRSR